MSRKNKENFDMVEFIERQNESDMDLYKTSSNAEKYCSPTDGGYITPRPRAVGKSTMATKAQLGYFAGTARPPDTVQLTDAEIALLTEPRTSAYANLHKAKDPADDIKSLVDAMKALTDEIRLNTAALQAFITGEDQ